MLLNRQIICRNAKAKGQLVLVTRGLDKLLLSYCQEIVKLWNKKRRREKQLPSHSVVVVFIKSICELIKFGKIVMNFPFAYHFKTPVNRLSRMSLT